MIALSTGALALVVLPLIPVAPLLLPLALFLTSWPGHFAMAGSRSRLSRPLP